MLMRFNVNVYLIVYIRFLSKSLFNKLKSDVSLPARIHTLEVFYKIYFNI